jgi:hypothetical protein
MKSLNHYRCNKQRALLYKKQWYAKHKQAILLQDASKRLRTGRTKEPHAKTISKLKAAGLRFDDNNRFLCVETAASDPTAAADEMKIPSLSEARASTTGMNKNIHEAHI